LGSSIYHVGIQFGRWSQNRELDQLSQAMYHARELAMTRMEAEADALGADGIVGVRLDIEFKEFGSDLAEFIAIGTAVKADEAPASGGTWRNRHNQPFTSDLSGQDFWTLIQAGYAPLGMVMGSCVYHIAHQRSFSAMANVGRNVEITQFTEALYDARELAMSRMEAEADVLGADGIVAVRLEIEFKEFGNDLAEFIAIGTAVKAEEAGTWRNNTGKPFTSDLNGQDFWTLVQAGYAPLGMVMGSCVYHIAHQRFFQAIGNIGQNVEVPQFTEALYDARELAMSRMQAEAEALQAEGIVGVQLLSLPHRWGGHTTEFFAIGTAIRPLRADHTIAKPQLVLPLVDS
ncbi:MAG TPA: heavy metal-binding domain-containing protein, partial [Micromonosporaceae bacterium]